MTRVNYVTVVGLAGKRGEKRIDFHPETNILWGLNGSGKTTLLKLISKALRNDTNDLESLPFQSAQVGFYSENFDAEFVRTIERDSIPKQEPALARHFEALGEFYQDDLFSFSEHGVEAQGWDTDVVQSMGDGDLGSVDEANVFGGSGGVFAHRFLPIARVTEPAGSHSRWAKLSEDERFAEHANKVWRDYLLRSNSRIRAIQQGGLAQVLSSMFGGTDRGGDEESRVNSEEGGEDQSSPSDSFEVVSQFLETQGIILPLGRSDFLQRYETFELIPHVVRQIRAVMSRVDQESRPQEEFQRIIEGFFVGDKSIVLDGSYKRAGLQMKIGSDEVPISSISSGEKQLLQILLETLASRTSSIIIDEPEISLHVDWQRDLVASMRRVNAEAQFILATHSPELMVDAPDDYVTQL